MIPPRLLVVEDDLFGVEILKQALGDEFALTVTTSGEEALAKLETVRPDLILLDIVLPGIDGYELCRRIRGNPDLAQAKILLLSGHAKTAERLRGYRAGADDYVSKPFEPSELLAKIRVFLRLKRAEEMEHLKGELLDLLAHEIRTPLSGILPPAELLAGENAVADEDRRMWASMILESGRRLVSFAECATVLANERNGTLAMARGEVDLASLVHETVAEARRERFSDRREFKVDAGDCAALGDEGYLRLLIEVLLENAERSSTPRSPIRVSCAAREGGVSLTVVTKDESGCGSGVFRPLAPIRHGGETVGSDVGIATARAIVGAHGGNVSVTLNELGLRTVDVRLPSSCRSG